MRMISCHIENFGKLKDYDYQFNALNVIHEDNGWGKSTLATFIRVMFYGFSGENKRKIVENERKKYKPWQMGTYGGNLVFAVGQREYRLERVFGTKKNEDSFALYDNVTNLKSEDFPENIGEKLFGIDLESFMRTVFIAQQDCGTEVTSDINAQIGNVSDQTADIGNYDNVQLKLKKEMDRLTPNRVTGELSKLNSRIGMLKEQIRNKSFHEENIETINQKIADLEEQKEQKRTQLKQIQDEITKVSAIKDSAGLIQEYEGLCVQEKDAAKTYEQKRGFFVGELPQTEELNAIIEKGNRYPNCLKELNECELTDEQKIKLNSYVNRFKQGVPEESILESIEEKTERLNVLNDQRNRMMLSDTEQQKLKQGNELFASYLPSEDELDSLIDRWSERKSKKDVLSTKRASAELFKQATSNNQSTSSQGNMISIILIVAALGSFLGGIGLFFAINSIAISGVGIVVGIILLAIGILQLNKKQSGPDNNSTEDAGYNRLFDEIREDERYIEETERSCNAFFEKMGIPYNEYEVLRELGRIRGLLSDYNNLKERSRENESDNLEEQIAGLDTELSGFFDNYKMDRGNLGYDKLLYQLKQMIAEFKFLSNDKEKYEKLLQESQQLKTEISGFIRTLGFEVDSDLKLQLNNIQGKMTQLSFLESQWKSSIEKKQKFEENNDIDGLKEKQGLLEQLTSMEELNQSYNEVIHKLEQDADTEKSFNENLEKELAEYEKMETAENELNELLDVYEGTNKKYEIIKKTRAYLEKAKENFSGKYTEAILESFQKYHHIISDDDGKYSLDVNLNVKVEEKGHLREIDILSEGYQDLVGLCRRMAFVDAMYDQEKPFLIFDDPFVNLDEGRVEGAMDFLKQLSQEYQVIYFTCHESRCI